MTLNTCSLADYIVPDRPMHNKFMTAVDAVERKMVSQHYGLCNGAVYKKIPESMYTYIFVYSVKTYLYKCMNDRMFANHVTNHINQLVALLSDPDCALIKPITIDYNYIECLPEGVCFDIPNKKFVRYPPELKGSPRTFIRAKPKRNPNPRPFIEGECRLNTLILPIVEEYGSCITYI